MSGTESTAVIPSYLSMSVFHVFFGRGRDADRGENREERKERRERKRWEVEEGWGEEERE